VCKCHIEIKRYLLTYFSIDIHNMQMYWWNVASLSSGDETDDTYSFNIGLQTFVCNTVNNLISITIIIIIIIIYSLINSSLHIARQMQQVV